MRTFDFTAIAALMGRPEDALLTPADLGVFPHILIESGILVEAKCAESILCPCGGGGHSENVERDLVRGKVHYSVYCTKSGGLFDIPAADLRLWKISIAAILKRIRSSFNCPNEPDERIAGLWYLGEGRRAAAGFRRQIFFAERMTSAVEKELPEGTTQLLIIGEASPTPIMKFKDRIFQMHEIFRLEDGDIKFDMALIEERLKGKAPDAKKKTVPKKGKRAVREDTIKIILKEHLRSAKDAYWKSLKGAGKKVLFPRPTAQGLADLLKLRTGEVVDQSTVNRTIAKSKDEELKILWDGCNDERYIRDFERKRKSAPRRHDEDDDEAYIAEMFSQSSIEPLGDGFHEA